MMEWRRAGTGTDAERGLLFHAEEEKNELGVRCSTCLARWHRWQGDAINIGVVIKQLSSNEGWGCGGGFGGCTLDLVQPTRRVNRPLFLLHPHFQLGHGDFGLEWGPGSGRMAGKVLATIETQGCVCVRACASERVLCQEL